MDQNPPKVAILEEVDPTIRGISGGRKSESARGKYWPWRGKWENYRRYPWLKSKESDKISRDTNGPIGTRSSMTWEEVLHRVNLKSTRVGIMPHQICFRGIVPIGKTSPYTPIPRVLWKGRDLCHDGHAALDDMGQEDRRTRMCTSMVVAIILKISPIKWCPAFHKIQQK